MSDAQAAWLAANTFECRKLKARITPRQCETNRTATSGLTSNHAETSRGAPPQCATCTDWMNAEKELSDMPRGRCQEPGCGKKGI